MSFGKIVAIELNVQSVAIVACGIYTFRRWMLLAYTVTTVQIVCCSFVELWVVLNHYYYFWHFQFDWIYLRRSIQRQNRMRSTRVRGKKNGAICLTCVCDLWRKSADSVFYFVCFKFLILICVKLNTVGSLSFLLFHSSNITDTVKHRFAQTNQQQKKVKTKMFIQFNWKKKKTWTTNIVRNNTLRGHIYSFFLSTLMFICSASLSLVLIVFKMPILLNLFAL